MTNQAGALNLRRIDHIAIAVRDLDAAIAFYRDVLGFELREKRITYGKTTSMASAVAVSESVVLVLMQGREPDSQISRYIRAHGAGVQHVAFEVDDLERVGPVLGSRGLSFATSVLESKGIGQRFSTRDPVSGMMFEFIQRSGNESFSDDNVRELFEQIEQKGLY